MISTQAHAMEEKDGGGTYLNGSREDGAKAIKQCNQIANISKRTIKAAISGVPIAEVINKWAPNDKDPGQLDLKNITNPDDIPYSQGDAIWTETQTFSNMLFSDMLKNDSISARVRAIYKTVDQIKTKYGQVRPQDRVRLNNRVEQKLRECVKLIDVDADVDVDGYP